MADEITGYLHPLYAASLSEFGKPQLLPESQGWLIRRPISGTEGEDAMGCYPLFSCRDWSRLEFDIENLRGQLLSVTMVTDPFGDYDEEYLRHSFRDKVVRFKDHFVTDLEQRMESFVQPHHQRNVQKSLQALQVEYCAEPDQLLEDWNRLYSNLVRRHNIRGLAAFSRASFANQFQVPGLVAFQAQREGRNVGMTLWYLQRNVAYYHLAAYSDEGYELRGSFALFWTAMKYFSAAGIRWLSLGAGAGATNDGMDGLTRFKRGWSTATRPSYLCGRILDEKRYRKTSSGRGMGEAEYFPAYRAGEFA